MLFQLESNKKKEKVNNNNKKKNLTINIRILACNNT